ncbi:MAG: hypothetical protein C5B52_19145 [Bacteroidetes bacterium]|nr:MAG: hypothetical protein C5B52_19145 [Bacteroidota bacterium]
MKMLFIMLVWLFIAPDHVFNSEYRSQTFIDPTGTYILKGKFQNSVLKGRYGEIRVKLLDSTSIAMTFYMNSGYPNYFAGAFIDTLMYDGTSAIYSCSEQKIYKINFRFSNDEVELSQLYEDPHSSCGFESGVIVSGAIKKYSKDTPVIKPIRTGS